MENNNNIDNFMDDFIKKNIGGIEECCPSDDFVDKVMCCCCEYEERKEARILSIKRYSLLAIPLFIISVIIFVPGLSGLLLSLFSKITLSGILKYYTFTSVITIISTYILLTERIVKFIKRHRQSPLPLEIPSL